MNAEQEMLHRIEQAGWYRAPSNIEEFCLECGQKIRPDETIAEIEDGNDLAYIHAVCWEIRVEDMREETIQ